MSTAKRRWEDGHTNYKSNSTSLPWAKGHDSVGKAVHERLGSHMRNRLHHWVRMEMAFKGNRAKVDIKVRRELRMPTMHCHMMGTNRGRVMTMEVVASMVVRDDRG